MTNLLDQLARGLGGRYSIERELGRGGMATVFLARDLQLGRRVAIKVLDPEVAFAIGSRHFLREIETVAQLGHPHILPLFDSGEAGGLLYFAMPYVEGESLRARLAREKQLPTDDALRITREIADGLNYAHAHGLVHRDVKPENILLEGEHAVIADFGIARAVAAASTPTFTPAGMVAGTPIYMSPEQSAGSRDLDGRSDQYSLGCVLHEMLAGQPPFTGPTAEILAHQHMNVTPRPVTELRPTVPASVAAALQRALAKAPADRFGDMGQFAAALAPTPTTERPMSAAVPPPRRPKSRHRLILSVSAATMLVAAWMAFTSGWLPHPRGATRSRAVSAVPRTRVLVAAFDGPPDDPSLARAVREVVAAALDQSPTLATVPPDQIALALQQAGKPDTLRLSSAVAREIAYRLTVRTVVEGGIVPVARRFAITVRVTDVEQGRQVLTLTDYADSQDALIPVLTRMAGRVRQSLGEDPGALRTTRPEEWSGAATPSFEAYRRWADGMRLYYASDFTGARQLFRDAVEIDPDFGSAWGSIAMAYRMLGRMDSAIVASEEALKRPWSLTPAYKLYVEGRLMCWRGDVRGGLEAFHRVEQLYPGSTESRWALNNGALVLLGEGRLEEGLAAEMQAQEGYLVNQIGRQVRTSFLLPLGRYRGARAEIDSLREPYRLPAELNLALAERDWRRADSIATAVEGEPRSVVGSLVAAANARATVSAVRGKIDAADAHFRRAGELQHDRGQPSMAPRVDRDRVTLAIASRRPAPGLGPWLERDTTISALITRAYVAACRDTQTARELLAELRSRPTVRLGAQGSTAEFIEALIAARAGRWGEVVRLVAEPARAGWDRGHRDLDRIGVAPERWLVAQAYEHLGRPDSAVAFYWRLLAPESPRAFDSFARQRLVMLYASTGNIDAAERQLAILEGDFVRPDPDIRQLLDEARAAVRAARGIARRG